MMGKKSPKGRGINIYLIPAGVPAETRVQYKNGKDFRGSERKQPLSTLVSSKCFSSVALIIIQVSQHMKNKLQESEQPGMLSGAVFPIAHYEWKMWL